jgi:TonB family protein
MVNRSIGRTFSRLSVPLFAICLFCSTGGVMGQTKDSGVIAVNILSDTHGANFEPYMKQVISMVQTSWASLLPEAIAGNRGKVAIRFTISQAGRINAMVLSDSSHQIAVDRAAWGSITSVGQFPSLPATFNAPSLTVEMHFNVARNQGSTEK